ncbi:hypothetical protein P9209_05105 [Prescottella defluvii]|nr:hypothetical protein P9209_05105 [Prescottella defluvii]
MNREIRDLLLAATTAVVAVTGAVVVVAHAGGDGIRKITGTVDAAPGLGWSVDAAAMYGQSFAEFRDPRNGSEYDWGDPGFVYANGVVVSVVGVSDGGMSLRNPVMVGIDATSGEVRWQSPADDLGDARRFRSMTNSCASRRRPPPNPHSSVSTSTPAKSP